MTTWAAEHVADAVVTVSTAGPASLGGPHISTGTWGSANWPAANRAIYVPARLARPVVLAQLWWHNGTIVSTPDVNAGVYVAGEDGAGRLVASAGTTTQSGGTAVQTVDVADVVIQPGVIYLALVLSVNNSGMIRVNPAAQFSRAVGMAQEALASVALPATMTPAAVVSTYLPLFGFTGRAVV